MSYNLEAIKRETLLEYHQHIRKINPVLVKRRVIHSLLDGCDDTDSITRKRVDEVIEHELRVWNVIKALKKGELLEAIELNKSFDEPVDFNTVLYDFEEILKTQIEKCFSFTNVYAAKELIDVFGKGIDFTDTIKEAYSNCIRLNMHKCAKQIIETFPDIDFNS